MDLLLKNIRNCVVCKEYLPCEPKPIISIKQQSKILIIGQAPGTKVQNSGVPWDDASGKELRRWLGVKVEQFYNNEIFGIMPMGFCFPGTGKSGDLPPRPECAPLWHHQVFEHLTDVKLIILIGNYAQKYYLKNGFPTLTENVQQYQKFLPNYFPLVHPSPRNKIWQKRNPWFEQEVIIELREIINTILYDK
jgi:uracil-DNA glycosylase